jgi:FkbM family methyltransferase
MHNHQPEITRFWREYLAVHPEGVLFDVGANYGIHSYRFLASGYSCVLFEPQAECVAFVRRVCLLNGWRPLIVEKVVGSREGEAAFYQSRSTWFSSSDPDWVAECGEEPVKVEVETVRLDAFCAAQRVVPNLIKIDVEGDEFSVLAGSQECLARRHPTLVVEVWKRTGNREGVWDAVAPHGYAVMAIERRGVREIADRREFLACDASDFVFTTDDALRQRLQGVDR